MDPRAGFDRLVASFTFSGSLISFAATTVVLISYVTYRQEQRSFRHALIFNLALAEFINTLNNTLSGAIYLRDKALYPGPACTANGFIGQLSVQASDFSILSIAVITLLTITRTTYMPNASSARKIGICVSVWVIPITTATIAATMGAIGPVSGNWCWIMSTRTDLRYSLTHGWRIAIVFFTVGIYLYTWWYMNRHFRTLVSTAAYEMASTINGNKDFQKMRDSGLLEAVDEEQELSAGNKSRTANLGGYEFGPSAPEAAHTRTRRTEDQMDMDGDVDAAARYNNRWERRDSVSSTSGSDGGPGLDDRTADEEAQQRPSTMGTTARCESPPPGTKMHSKSSSRSKVEDIGVPQDTGAGASEFPTRRTTRQMEREIKLMLLLNAYPIMYVFLWIPGLTNRFMEATGHKSNSRVLAALQASSQFVGLANALTYGFNAMLRQKVKRWWRGRKGGKGRRRR